MPIRKIPKNYRNVTGIAAHRKAEGPAGFESTLERDFITLLEFRPDAERFEVQPLTIEWTDAAGRDRKYTPDVLVEWSRERRPGARPTLYEVKYRSDIGKRWDELKPKFKAALRFAKVQGWRFELVTEREIRTPYLNNAGFLLPFVRRGPEVEEHMELLADALDRLGESTPAGLLAAIYRDEWNRAALLPTLWYLVGTFQVGADLDAPLNMESRLWRVRA